MKIFILAVFMIIGQAFAQEKSAFEVQWHDYYWNSAMIQNKYSEWPKNSVIEIETISHNQIKVSSTSTGYQKTIILRGNQSVNSIIQNPNLLKPILFGMRENNSMVNIYPTRY